MTGSIGTSQVSIAVTTLAQTTLQTNWFRRWCSDPIAAQTIAGQSIGLHAALAESNTNSLFSVTFASLFLWRPSTGARIATLTDPGAGALATPGLTETAESGTDTTNFVSGVTASDGDILVLEFYGNAQQSMATSYTNTLFYDGTTEDSATSNAAYLLFTNDVALSVPHVPYTTPYPQLLPQ